MRTSLSRSLFKRALLSATIGVAAMLSTPHATRADETPSRKPTVVLVHGAVSKSASWDRVIAKLESDGYPVFAEANPLPGMASAGDSLRTLLAIGQTPAA